MDADVIVVGAGLAGLVATHELTSRGKKVALVDQENAANLGGQALWSFGGIFLVDSPEQRRMRVKDSFELAWNDWPGSAGFDRLDDQDVWAAKWVAHQSAFRNGNRASKNSTAPLGSSVTTSRPNSLSQRSISPVCGVFPNTPARRLSAIRASWRGPRPITHDVPRRVPPGRSTRASSPSAARGSGRQCSPL